VLRGTVAACTEESGPLSEKTFPASVIPGERVIGERKNLPKNERFPEMALPRKKREREALINDVLKRGAWPEAAENR